MEERRREIERKREEEKGREIEWVQERVNRLGMIQFNWNIK